jgi:hypothetical protein
MPILKSNLPANVGHHTDTIPVRYIVTEPAALVFKRPPRSFNIIPDSKPSAAAEPQDTNFLNFPRMNIRGIGL